MILKKQITFYSIITIIVSGLLILLLYGFKKMSEIIFLTTFYISILITIYFTYGPYITRKLIDNQLYNIFENFKYLNEFIKLDVNFDKNINKNTQIDNKKIEIKNKKIVNNVFKLLIITLIIGLCISFSIWLLTTKSKNYSIKLFYKEIVRNNIILLVIISIVQITFNTFITKNYIPLENDEIVTIIIDSINDNLIK